MLIKQIKKLIKICLLKILDIKIFQKLTSQTQIFQGFANKSFSRENIYLAEKILGP